MVRKPKPKEKRSSLTLRPENLLVRNQITKASNTSAKPTRQDLTTAPKRINSESHVQPEVQVPKGTQTLLKEKIQWPLTNTHTKKLTLALLCTLREEPLSGIIPYWIVP